MGRWAAEVICSCVLRAARDGTDAADVLEAKLEDDREGFICAEEAGEETEEAVERAGEGVTNAVPENARGKGIEEHESLGKENGWWTGRLVLTQPNWPAPKLNRSSCPQRDSLVTDRPIATDPGASRKGSPGERS